jgi:deoxycytidine triphosphate deaminase
MSVIPLALGQTVVTTKEEFDLSGGRNGSALLIQNFDEGQLVAGSPNLSYDLRIGAVYKDHRDGGRRDLPDDGSEDSFITLLPGGAVVIETEEDLHMPRGMLGYIVPRVKWLQEGVSNTLSKVDAGYNGHLLVTLFNLGRITKKLPRKERFCSLVVHRVGTDPEDPEVCLYDKDAKRITGPLHKVTVWQKERNVIEAHPATTTMVLALVTFGLILATAALAVVEFQHLHHAVVRPGS